MKNIIKIFAIICVCAFSLETFAFNTQMGPELYRSYGKQQIKIKSRGGKIKIVTPNFKDYIERNEYLSEKFVCIFSSSSPAYGFQYVLYTPIGNYVGFGRITQKSLNGYGYDAIACDEGFPHFKTVQEAKKYYYPEIYN